MALLIGAGLVFGALGERLPAQTAGAVERSLLPGDHVKLTVWREPDLSGEFEVKPDGSVMFPKIGRIQVDQVSTDSLRTVIVARYSESLRDPAIEVTPLRRIVVSGSVRDAGFHYAGPTITVGGALALAGGVTSEGDQKRVELVRNGQRTSIKLASSPSLADSPVQSGDQIRAPERSWASRNTVLIASGLTAIAVVLSARLRP